jgi:hypothetical protein
MKRQEKELHVKVEKHLTVVAERAINNEKKKIISSNLG